MTGFDHVQVIRRKPLLGKNDLKVAVPGRASDQRVPTQPRCTEFFIECQERTLKPVIPVGPGQYPLMHQARILSPPREMSRRIYISYDIYQMQHISPDSLFAVLANTTRLRSLMLLFKHGELCVCDLTEVTGAAQPNISRNLAQMRDTGLLADRRQGQWVYYQINPDVPAWVTDVLQAVASGTFDLNPYKKDDDVLAGMPARSDSRCCS